MKPGQAVAIATAALVLGACGGGGSGAATTAAWNQRHGAAVGDVGAALDHVSVATKGGDPIQIRTSCSALQESLAPVRAALPVPDQKADAALRTALDRTDTGATDCLRAIGSGDARLLERAISELADARLQLDTANAALSV